MSKEAFEPIKSGLQELLEMLRSGEWHEERTSGGVLVFTPKITVPTPPKYSHGAKQ